MTIRDEVLKVQHCFYRPYVKATFIVCKGKE